MAQLQHIIERRQRLRGPVVRWAVVALATGIVAALLPEPDTSRILFRELAEAHYRATSTLDERSIACAALCGQLFHDQA